MAEEAEVTDKPGQDAAAQSQDSTTVGNSTAADVAQPQGGEGDKAAPAAEAGKDAGASTEKGEKPPQTSFEVVKERHAALRAEAEKKAGRAEKSAESPPAETSKKEPDKAAAAPTDEDKESLLGKVDKAEWDAMGPRGRKRITQYRTALKERDALIKTAEPKAKAHDYMVTWCGQNNVSTDEVNYALNLMASIKSDPAKALKSLEPILSHLRKEIGEELPADLAARVSSGEISEAAAKELAREKKDRERTEAKLAGERKAAEQREQDERALSEANRTHGEITEKLRVWEGQWKSSDPDYSKKWPHVWKRLRPELAALQSSGKPYTVEQVTELARKARAEVEELMSDIAPPVRQVRTVTGGASTKAQPLPRSSLEAVKTAYAGMRQSQ